MSLLRKIAQSVRHHPFLAGAEWLWQLARKPYHWALDPMGRGLRVRLGGHCEVRIPPEFAGFVWEEYEPETFAFLQQWVRNHADPLVVDIGCSIGIFSAAALFADPRVEVIAFDPDLASIATVSRVTRYAAGERLRLVHGFVGRQTTEIATLDGAVTATARALAGSGLHGDLHSVRYLYLSDTDARSIPCYRLDDVLPDGVEKRPMLIKCDVEGAELEVLMGASATLRRFRPDLLLSIHSWNGYGLPQYGHSKEDVEAFLRAHDYSVACLAVDHEEHWACRWQAPDREPD